MIKAFHDVQATRDAKALQASLPRLSISRKDWIPGPYRRYVDEVSIASMAASEEISHFLASVCESLEPTSVLDLGSGFSSFVLRHYDCEVWSVDDDEAWLDKTKVFLAEYGLPTQNLLLLGDLDWSQQHDVVFHDIGSIALRKKLLLQAFAATRPGGLLILDDIHKIDLLQLVNKEFDVPRFSLRKWTEDEYGRFGMAILPD